MLGNSKIIRDILTNCTQSRKAEEIYRCKGGRAYEARDFIVKLMEDNCSIKSGYTWTYYRRTDLEYRVWKNHKRKDNFLFGISLE